MFPPPARALLSRGEPAVLGTMAPDGRPRSWVMWAGLEGDEVVMTTRPHRRQATDVRRDPRVSVLVYDRAAPTRYVEVLGRGVVEEEGGERVTAMLQSQYLGVRASTREGRRVVIRVHVDRVGFYEWA